MSLAKRLTILVPTFNRPEPKGLESIARDLPAAIAIVIAARRAWTRVDVDRPYSLWLEHVREMRL